MIIIGVVSAPFIMLMLILLMLATIIEAIFNATPMIGLASVGAAGAVAGTSAGLGLGAGLAIAAVGAVASIYTIYGLGCMAYAAHNTWKNNSSGAMTTLMDPRNYLDKNKPITSLVKGAAYLTGSPFLLIGGLLGLGARKSFDKISTVFNKKKNIKLDIVDNADLDSSKKMNSSLLQKNHQQKEKTIDKNQTHYDLPFVKTNSKNIKSEQVVSNHRLTIK